MAHISDATINTSKDLIQSYLTGDESSPDNSALHESITTVSAAAPLDPDRVTLKPEEREEITGLVMSALRPISHAQQREAVNGIARGLEALYIDEGQGKAMAKFIREQLDAGAYSACRSPLAFQEMVLRDLQSICPDKHLSINYSVNPIPADDECRSTEEIPFENLTLEQLRKCADFLSKEKSYFERNNFGIGESRILPGTEVGYLKINQFASTDFPETGERIEEAMGKIAHSKALIIDLRDNEGGSPSGVERIASYFFDQPTLINHLYQRSNNKTTDFYADPESVEARFGGKKPIVILTNENTFSAAEELSYDLQAQERATIIGTGPTKGGAHPVACYAADDHFVVYIPYQKAVNPTTGTNWEGKGVKPDIVIQKDQDPIQAALDHFNKFF